MKTCFAGGSAITELRRVLEEYLSVLICLTKKGIFISSYSYTLFLSFMDDSSNFMQKP